MVCVCENILITRWLGLGNLETWHLLINNQACLEAKNNYRIYKNIWHMTKYHTKLKLSKAFLCGCPWPIKALQMRRLTCSFYLAIINQYIYRKTNNETLLTLTNRCPLSIFKEPILHDPIKSCCAKVAENLIPNSDLPSLSWTLSAWKHQRTYDKFL